MFEGAKHSTVQCEHEISPSTSTLAWHLHFNLRALR